MNWKPQPTSPPFANAANFYVNLVRKYGEPGAANDSFNQLLTLLPSRLSVFPVWLTGPRCRPPLS